MRRKRPLKAGVSSLQMTARIDFTYNGWDCWRNMFGEWGAILSRKGLQPIIITRYATKEELITQIDSL